MNASAKPLLSLHMIVKDEAASIERVVASAAPYIDRWDILDTGSSDGTPGLIERVLGGIPGQLYREAFVPFENTGIIDFGATRNRALELALPHASLTFWLSGDEYLFGGAALRAFCLENQDAPHGCYSASVHYDALHTCRPFLFRSGTSFRWSGPLHEWALTPPHESWGAVPDATLVLHTGSDIVRKNDRFERDLIVLERLRAREPTDGRTAFYFAQTLDSLGRHGEAAQAYATRVAMGGWDEEVYEAAFRRARELCLAGEPWPVVMAQYLAAHVLRPHRAEPLYEIAAYYAARDAHVPAYLFASMAAALPLPGDTLFVQHDVYTHRALHLVSVHGFYAGTPGAKEAGQRAAERLLEIFPDDLLRQRNLRAYTGESAPIVTREFAGRRLAMRDQASDAWIADEQLVRDVYRLGAMDLPPDATIIDGGTHAGFFATAALDRFPTATVLSYELDAESHGLATTNLARYGARSRLSLAALIGDRAPAGYLPLPDPGQRRIVYDVVAGAAQAPRAVTIAQALDEHAVRGRVDLLKLDVEGAEYEILPRAAADGVLARVDRISMEWHGCYAEDGATERLVELLEREGFVVERHQDETWNGGQLWAKRDAAITRDARVAAAAALGAL